MRIAVIGYGSRISNLVKEMLDMDSSCKLSAIADIADEETKKKLESEGFDSGKVRIYKDADELLQNGDYDGVCIGTRCSLHTPMALKVLPKRVPLFLEKPVATNMEDLLKLRDAYKKYGGKVVVSFPLRVTLQAKLVKEIIDSGKIGTVEHVQAVNNVPYGRVYYHNWYRDENETQGLFLQKATHDFDYINYMLGIKPVRVCAMKSKQIFKGEKPAGLMCKDCDEQETCPESPQNIIKHACDEPHGPFCCFAEDTGNEDSGSALIEYETGMHVSYSQNFFARKKAAARGAHFMGYKGTIGFDWFTEEVKVYMHQTPRVETYNIDPVAMSKGHSGGDSALVENFMDIVKGKSVESVSPLDAGLLSILMCLKAKESANTKTFQDIKWPDEI